MLNLIDRLSKIKLPFFANFEVYFDLGTSVTKIAIKDKGLILREATYLGLNQKTKEFLFFGSEAKSILGKTPDFIKIIRPVVSGVISDFDAEVALISKFLEKSVNLYFSSSWIKPALRGIAVTPTIATEIEQKAVQEALYKAGLSQVYVIEKAMATAAGCGINVFSHQPTLIADLGGGLIELSIIGSGGIIAQRTLRNAGDHMNKVIYNYIYLKYGVILGESTCEELKKTLLNFNVEEKTATIRGKSLESGLPKTVRVKSSDIKEALLSIFNQIIDSMKELIESAAPEIVDEVMRRGVILTGGLSKIPGLDKFIATEIKMDVTTAPGLEYATVNGLAKLALHEDEFSKLIIL
jgi:rod shape-determining protein MreB